LFLISLPVSPPELKQLSSSLFQTLWVMVNLKVLWRFSCGLVGSGGEIFFPIFLGDWLCFSSWFVVGNEE
jgi:hypothetical protein